MAMYFSDTMSLACSVLSDGDTSAAWLPARWFGLERGEDKNIGRQCVLKSAGGDNDNDGTPFFNWAVSCR